MSDLFDILLDLRRDPVLFARTMFGVEPDPWQREFLTAYGRGDRQIAARSCHGPGKTFSLSVAAIHHISTKYDAKALVTAPSSTQLKDALLPEIKKWIERMPPEMSQLFDPQAERIVFKPSSATNFISARTSRAEQPDALAGVHSSHDLLIGDEASGIPDQVFEFAGGLMSGENAQMILAGNPVRSVGYFADVFGILSHAWTTFTIGYTDSSRVSRTWVEEMRQRYGEDSNIFRVRCLGLPPLGDDDTVIPWELIVSAKQRDIEQDTQAPITWGVDVATFGGDESALAKRQANVQLEPVLSWSNLDTMQLCGRIKEQYDNANPQPDQINVDAIGLGRGVADRLFEMGLPAIAINVSETPAMKEIYRNLRAELWFRCREWFEARDARLDATDEELAKELAMPRYDQMSTGRFIVESKKDMKKRGKPSPNKADAWVLTFANEASRALGMKPSRWTESLKRNLKRLV